MLLQELWSLLEFMMPNIFSTGNADSKGILNSQGDDLIVRIKSILGPFILRRLKSDVMQQLVPKIQKVIIFFILHHCIYNVNEAPFLMVSNFIQIMFIDSKSDFVPTFILFLIS